MSLEQRINYQLNKFPEIKKVIKRVYQTAMYVISKKTRSEGDIIRISPDDENHEYFFGYYDKSPWDVTDRYMLCMKASNTWLEVSPHENADILLIDTWKEESDSERIKKIAETRAWNVQQSCMLQWLGPDFSSRVIYNDYRDGKYVSVILTLATMEERVIQAPIYSVAADGRFALTLDFSRLYELRPGYGYYNVTETTKGVALPNTTAIWRVDLETGEVSDVLKYTDFANFQPRQEMQDVKSVHKVNHIMLNPDGNRFMVLYRWLIGDRKYTRLITCNVDGTDMYVLSDDDMVSHCCWKDDEHIIAFENKKKSGVGYYLMKDKTQKYYHCWPEMTGDGHPSFSPDGSLVVTDTYPDRARIARLKVMDGDVRKSEVNTIAKVFAPFKYDNDTRCDLHPRWDHAGDKICFDGVFEGHRGLYIVRISGCKKTSKKETAEMANRPKFSVITPMFNSFDKMKTLLETMEKQQKMDFELVIVDDCSTDDSYNKIVKYANESSLSIRVFQTANNSGAGIARNIGLEASEGEWLVFIDSDDYVDESFFTILERYAKDDIDILIYDYYQVTEEKEQRGYSLSCHKREPEGMVDKEKAILWGTSSVCGKVYKRDLIISQNIQFPNLKRYEDWVFYVCAVASSKKIYYVTEPLYYYVDNPVSVVHSNKSNVYQYSLAAFNLIKNKLEFVNSEIVEALYIREVIYVAAKDQLSYYSPELIKSIIERANIDFPNWRNNKFIRCFSSKQRLLIRIVCANKIFLLKIMGWIIR